RTYKKRVKPHTLNHPLFSFVLSNTKRSAIAIEATILLVPTISERVIDQCPGHRLGLLRGAMTQSRFCFQDQIGRLDIMSIRIVVRNRPPIGGEIEVHYTRLDTDPIANNL